MGRHRGPVEKLSRREGVQLHLKGERVLAGKSAIERRAYPPGEHGRRRRRQSEYGLQLREKQKAKRYYGVRERQFANCFRRATAMPGLPGETLLRLLEQRLDNVVYRLGFAGTRAQARQFIVHGHVVVNGRKVDRPSFSVRPGDTVAIWAGSAVEPTVRAVSELIGFVPAWLLADHDALSGVMVREPDRPEIPAPVDEQRIVEHYSK